MHLSTYHPNNEFEIRHKNVNAVMKVSLKFSEARKMIRR